MLFKSSKMYKVSEESICHLIWLKVWRTMRVLLWKVYILRKRHLVLTFLELTAPVFLFWIVVHFRNMLPEKEEIRVDTGDNSYLFLAEMGNYQIAYTPSNNITDILMQTARTKMLPLGCNVKLASGRTEEEVVHWLKTEYSREVSGKPRDPVTSPKGVGVIFSDTGHINNLTYTLRTTQGNIDTTENTLYGEKMGKGNIKYMHSGFLTVQAAIDQAYLTMIQNISIPEDTLVNTLPYVDYTVVDLVQMLMSTIISLGFTFIMPSLLKEVVEERTSGIKELMKIKGLNPLLNWLSWMIYSMVVYVPVTMCITLVLTIDSGTGPPVHANFFLVWGMFLIFAFSFITLILAISTFFTNGIVAMIAGELIWYGVTIVLDTFICQNPDKFNMFVQALTCLWPSIAMVWSIKTIHNFHRSGNPWTLRDLFNDGAGGGRISVGVAVLMMFVDMAIFIFIAWYMGIVKPGPYGRAKPFWFIFECFKKKEKPSNIVLLQKESQENFEKVPKNVSVGIQIDNLVKEYSNGKVVAVNNVNLNIYKGTITALLGHNGAGKTTLMSMLAGFFSPTSGQVLVNEKNIFDNMEEFRSSLGLCPQDNMLFSYFTTMEHLIFFGMLKGMSMRQAEEKGESILKILKMYNRKNYTIQKLSGGMKRKVSLAIALLGDPEVVLLDEPTSGMDPESRRQVWDILLTLRGQRTIIITTHFMEEADVLGDRVAIMDHGQVSCYGTPMYLKRIYGKGYQLNIVKQETSSVDAITQVVMQHTTSATVKEASPTQMIFNIKVEDSPRFPGLFSALDNQKTSLGLKAININCTTMDDVFLSVIGSDKKIIGSSSSDIHIQESTFEKLTGCKLTMQRAKALIYKRILVRLRSWKSTILSIIIPVVLMAATVLQMMYRQYSLDQRKLQISLSRFPKVTVAMQSSNKTVSDTLKEFVTMSHAKYEVIPPTWDIIRYMLNKLKGENNLVLYERTMIAGFEMRRDTFFGGYSHYFDHSYALVLNMIANILLQLHNVPASISVYTHPIALYDADDLCDRAASASEQVGDFPIKVIFLSLGLLVMTMSLIPYPLKERVVNLKQVQLMSGVSPFLYWLIMFLCDLIFSLVTAFLMVCTIVLCEQNEILSKSGYLGTVAVIIVLFIFSGSLFAYFFSFFVKSSVKATISFVMFNLAVGLFGATFISLLDQTYTSYGVYRFFLSFNPLFSATSALIHLFTAMYMDGTCLQCGSFCNLTDPYTFLIPGHFSEHPHGINSFLIFLVVDIFIYLVLVLVVEYGVTKRLKFLISSFWIVSSEEVSTVDGNGTGDDEDDDDVRQEVEDVRSFHSVNSVPSVQNAAVLQVFELGKKYNRKTTAVHGVTFKVGQGECFGLLGVNGAGKTTTFKMLTGEEIPLKGDASIQDYSLRENKTKFLSQVGYCPQFDPISPQLTGREMLRVFALLRGIPTKYCSVEVQKWIKILALQEFADRQCGTYSGGNKRKLSTAMAFIGAPPVVFLDEPTSGVDPVSRRTLWDIVTESQRTGQAIVLTSHSMEECESLCSRLTIMVAGRMKCIGSPHYLKSKFGQGYTIKIKMSSSIDRKMSLNLIKEDISSKFKKCVLKDENLGLLHYHLKDPKVPLAKVFETMEELKKDHAIMEDYVISNTTLEEVFMSFARQKNKSYDDDE